jgi:replicative DNA helicase
MADKKPPTPARPESFRPQHNVDSLRTPPQSVESEQAVIGGLMLAPSTLDRVLTVLSEKDFYRRDHRLIFRGIVELGEKNKPFDAVTLGEWFEANCLSEQVGGGGYLIELASTTPSAANIIAYAEIVREKSVRRQLIELGTESVNDGFEPEGKDVSELLADAERKLAKLAQTSHNADLMRPADLAALMGQQKRPPRFVIDPYLPEDEVTLLSSHGGSGKTTVAEIIAAHLACGCWVFNARADLGHVVMFSFEDDGGKVAYKLSRIADAYELDPLELQQNMRVFDWSEGDTALATEISIAGTRDLVPTPLFDRLKVAARGARLIIIDNASEVFDGDENNRRQVGKFMRMLRGLARAQHAAVLLLAHIDKASAKDGGRKNNYSGSTTWHNSARSRLTLIDKDDAIELTQEKNNHGRLAEPFRLRWAEHGVLVPIGDGSGGDVPEVDAETALHSDMVVVLKCIRAAAVAGSDVCTNRSGQGNAHLLLSTFGAMPSRLKGSKGKGAFWAAFDQLIATGQLEIIQGYNASRNLRQFVVEPGKGRASLLHPPHPLSRENSRTHERESPGPKQGTDEGFTKKNHELTKPAPDFRSAAAGDNSGEA